MWDRQGLVMPSYGYGSYGGRHSMDWRGMGYGGRGVLNKNAQTSIPAR